MSRGLSLALVGAAAVLTQGAPALPQPAAVPPDFGLTLVQDRGHIAVCHFSLEVRASGEATVDIAPLPNAVAPGRHTFRLDAEQMSRLAALADSADLNRVATAYRPASTPGVVVHYAWNRVLGVRSSGLSRTVEYVAVQNLPQGLAALQNELIALTEPCAYANEGHKLVPALRRVGFDFSSQEAAVMLVRAARNPGQLNATYALLDAGAPLDGVLQDGRDQTLFEAAILNGSLPLYRRLKAAGVKPPSEQDDLDRALASAVIHEEPEMVRDLLRFGAKVGPGTLTTFTRRTSNPEADQLAVVDMVLQAGADPRAVDGAGNTPLHGVVRRSIIERLLEAGADINAVNGSGLSPLLMAPTESHAFMWIGLGADTSVKGPQGTIADIARARRWWTLVEALEAEGAENS